MGSQIQFLDIYKSFDSNMQALYTLHVAIEDSIGAKEWEILRDYYKEIFPLFGDDIDPFEIQAILERLVKIDIEDDTLDYGKILNVMNIDVTDVYILEDGKYVMTKDCQNELKKWAKSNPESANKFFRVFLKTQRQELFKSELSRQGLLLSAVSQFEFLALHLLRAYFAHYEKDIELSENYTIEDLDEAISQRFGKKNIKNIGMGEKINFLLQKYTLTGFSLEHWNEIVERRNVFTHRSGKADQTYINRNTALYGKPHVNLGDKLRINKNYIKDSIEYLHFWGLILCQKVWRKSETDAFQAGKSLAETTMQLIREKRYSFGVNFCKAVFENIRFNSQYNKDILTINYAICADRLGDVNLKTKLLGRINQIPRQSVRSIKKVHLEIVEEFLSNRILMAIAALEGNKQRALDYMEHAADSGEITFLDLDYWVIFDYLRDDTRYRIIQEKLEAKVKLE